MTTGAIETTSQEHQDLLDALATHRFFLRTTARDLTDDQARLRPTPSALCIGGLIKHVAATEAAWVDFILEGPTSMPGDTPELRFARMAEFDLGPEETLADAVTRYEAVARRTDELVAALADLNASHPLPDAPWFEPGARWSHRRVLVHIIAETSQHAGHADIIREAIDGAKTMG